MLIIPAIDLKDGACVRLRQGRMEDSTVFSTDEIAPGNSSRSGCAPSSLSALLPKPVDTP